MRHFNIDFQFFLIFFYLIFRNGFPSSLIVGSKSSFWLINENSLNCTLGLILLCLFRHLTLFFVLHLFTQQSQIFWMTCRYRRRQNLRIDKCRETVLKPIGTLWMKEVLIKQWSYLASERVILAPFSLVWIFQSFFCQFSEFCLGFSSVYLLGTSFDLRLFFSKIEWFSLNQLLMD